MFNKGQLAGLMKQAQAMQDNLKKAQEELGNIEVEGESGAGLVKVVEAHRRPRLDEWPVAMADPPLLAEVGHLPRPPLVNGGDCGRQVGGRERARTDDPKIVRHEDSPRCLQAHASVRP